jgi:hypothetical protein
MMNGRQLLLLGGLLVAGACSRTTPLGQVDDAGTGGVDTGAFSATTPDGRCLVNAYPNADESCVCQQDTPTPCLTACVNLMTDDDNCGACGHVCQPTSACAAGQCGPTSTTAVPARAGCGSLSLVAANGTLTWADKGHGLIMSSSTLGPTLTPTRIASGEHAPVGVLMRGAAVFWLASVDLAPATSGAGMDAGSSTSTIRRAAEGSVTDVVAITAAKRDLSDPGAIHGFTVSDDGDTVYFSTGPKIQRVPTTGGSPSDVVVMDTLGDPAGLVLGGDLLAFTIDGIIAVDIAQVGDVVAHCWHDDPMTGLPLDVNCNRVAQGQAELNLGCLTLDADKVFFVDGSALKAHTFSLAPRSDWMEISSVEGGSIRAAAASAGRVYFSYVDAHATGGIERVEETQGAAAIELARNVYGAGSIAVDGKKVFWSNADCEIQTTSTGE